MAVITKNAKEAPGRREYVVSLAHRKARGAGCERPAEILKAARELFLQQGVDNVTTRQIAARVGISQTALYVYFASKEEMLDALAKDAWLGLADALAAAEFDAGAETDPATRLRGLLAAYMRFWLRHADDFRIIFMRRALRSGLGETGCGLAARDSLLSRLAELFREAAQAGLVTKTCTPESAARAMWTAASGAVTVRLAFPDLSWPPEEEHIRATIDMICHGCDSRSAEGAARPLVAEPAH